MGGNKVVAVEQRLTFPPFIFFFSNGMDFLLSVVLAHGGISEATLSIILPSCTIIEAEINRDAGCGKYEFSTETKF